MLAEDTGLAIAIRARDEATPVLEGVAATVTRTSSGFSTSTLKMATSARRAGFEIAYLGGSVLQMAGYLERLNNPLADTGAHILNIAGGIASATGTALIFGATIVQLVPKIIALVNALRAWLATEAALITIRSFGLGAAAVAAGVAVGAGAYAATNYATRDRSSSSQPTVFNNYGVWTGDEEGMVALARVVRQKGFQETRLGR